MLLEMSGVYKRYGGVKALTDASLEVTEAEVHGLLGPNGSGKSTLNKVLTGTVKPEKALIRIDGQPVSINKPIDAYRHRISAVYQQLSLVPQMTVGENLTLGTESSRGGFISAGEATAAAHAALEPFMPGLDDGVTLNTEVSNLSPGSRQLVEVAKAIGRNPRILVLDEATASLRRDQVELVFNEVRRLVSEGVAVIFVSHRLDEIRTICSRATILRNGHTVATANMADTSEQQLIRLMVGDTVPDALAEVGAETRSQKIGPAVLRVEDLHSEKLHGINLEVGAGEIVGLGGLQGQGQSELLHTLFGDRQPKSGTVTVADAEVKMTTPRSAINSGFALVPGDRGTQGLMMKRPIMENLSIVSLRHRLKAGFLISIKDEKKANMQEVRRLSIKIGELSDPASSLSGGNQQKIVIGKWLLNEPSVVLLDDPTKGVDIGAKTEIYSIIRELTAAGVAVVLNSSDDEELLELCDRVLVLYEGTIVDHLQGNAITKDNLLAAALRIGEKDDENV